MNSDTPCVAVLYCEREGVYSTIPLVDLWDKSRNAMLYNGPYPIVGHPPCQRWSLLAFSNKNKGPEYAVGNDGGTFIDCFNKVMKFGGVLEHPAYSRAWDTFGLQKPQLKFTWERSIFGYWIIHLNQYAFGHKATKPTWLLYHSPDNNPPHMIDAPIWKKGDILCSRYDKQGKYVHGAYRSGSYGRIHTPKPLAEYLVALSRHAVSI